jgi:hypothetical protein
MSAAIRFDVRRVESILPAGLSDDDRDLLLQVAAIGIAAANLGEAELANRAAEVFTEAFADFGGEGGNPLRTCGDFCQHLLNGGDAPGYAVCYWACVARGGPVAVILPPVTVQRARSLLRGSGSAGEH